MYHAKQPLGTDVLKDVSDWAYDEFKEVEKGFQELDRIRLAQAFVEPAKRREGDIVFADGTDWNPGNGQGLYVYRGGGWVKLENTANGTITGSVGATDNRLVRSSGTSGTVLDSTGITADDSNNLSGIGTLDIGDPDTTLARASAGDINIEGNRIYRAGGTNVAIADGGTNADDIVTARTNLAVGEALLASGTGTGASLDIPLTSFTAYRAFRIVLTALPATDGVDLRCLFSTDGGSSFVATSYGYGAIVVNDSGSIVAGIVSAISGTTFILMNVSSANNQIGNATTEGWHGTIELIRPFSTAFWTRVHFRGAYATSAATSLSAYISGQGTQKTAQATDALRFVMSSGNLTYDYALYGMH